MFEQWLDDHFRESKEKVLGRLRDIRGGELNDARFGTRMVGEGEWAKLFGDLFCLTRRKVGIPETFPSLATDAFRRPEPTPTPAPKPNIDATAERGPVQRSLFDLID